MNRILYFGGTKSAGNIRVKHLLKVALGIVSIRIRSVRRFLERGSAFEADRPLAPG
jgi:hypothetical protein